MNAFPALARQMLRYAGVGGLSAIFHYGTLIVAVEWSGMEPVPASAAASAVGAVVNYALNYHFTFASQRSHAQSLPRFLAVALSGAALNIALMALGVELLGMHYLLTQVIATGIVFFWNFLCNRAWTFGAKTAP